MDYDTILYDLTGGIATITLDRPDRMNALTPQMRAELADALKRASEAARVIVLTGAGAAFCSGQDLGEGTTAAAVDLERVLRDEYEPIIRAIAEAPVPVMAAVNGPAAGAGANLALAADVVIAARSAYFLQAFTRIGLMPDAGGTYALPRQVGFARAMGAALFADKIDADQAADWGMIWEVFDDAVFEDGWRDRARQLADGPTQAYRAVKTAMRASFENDLEAQLSLEARLQGKCGTTRDFKEGVMAFREKRAAAFEGR
ncbi:enoyl-CoA hydratase-related protein [Maritimibacter sp. UBA3975]|uniref:enoyl-CoA hydratase-related protein n=1 Tax=Maritimibacter sp. UBA3975 TaxID=1946833 RepID=UPI000C0AD620|nr:enoyl-CoA hydratase-related protein [Maritimibacter sp. UBA3975]MAM61219.1 2-(1,2-epoxy-1,2-dihydrophenyl)acetyl-CoA isomerase [Maritimibacter sp.]|tara:strand:- start:9321 stop:10097 length:777 start_codon:yes stop_codon:yes gene_type:complete